MQPDDAQDGLTASFHSEPESEPAWQDQPEALFDDSSLEQLGSILCEGALEEEAAAAPPEHQSPPPPKSAGRAELRSAGHRRPGRQSLGKKIQQLASALIDSPRSPNSDSPTNGSPGPTGSPLPRVGSEEGLAVLESPGSQASAPVSPSGRRGRRVGFQFDQEKEQINTVLQEFAQTAGCSLPFERIFNSDEEITARNIGLRFHYASIYYLLLGFSFCCFALAAVAANLAVFFVVRWMFLSRYYTDDGVEPGSTEDNIAMIVGACCALGLDVVAGWAIWIIGVAQHRLGQAMIARFERFEDLVKAYVESNDFGYDCQEIFEEAARSSLENDELIVHSQIVWATAELQQLLIQRGLTELKGWDFFSHPAVEYIEPVETDQLLDPAHGAGKDGARGSGECVLRRMTLDDWMEFVAKELLVFSRSEETREKISLIAKRELEMAANHPDDFALGQKFGVTWQHDSEVLHTLTVLYTSTLSYGLQVDECPQCHSSFTIFFRRHHCRFCGTVVRCIA